jgi:hypothetical protein
MRTLTSIIFLAILSTGSGKDLEARPPIPSGIEAAGLDGWTAAVSVTGYAIPDDRDFLSPTFSADRDWLHLEGRYNYEAFNTGSLWLGWNLGFGEKIQVAFTPIAGLVMGHTRGAAAGWRLAVTAGAFEFTSESEHVWDARDSEDNFFYTWSELIWAPREWWWMGVVGQRTRVFQSDLDIQRGLLLGVTLGRVDLTGYVFNWGWGEPAYVLSVGFEF